MKTCGPDSPAFADAIKWLYAVIDPMKPFAREQMGKHFVEPPLEGLWWADDIQDFIHRNRDKLNWRTMIVFEPGWLTAAVFEDAVDKAKASMGEPPASLRIESLHEGLCAQIMHVGPKSGEVPTLARLHSKFLPAQVQPLRRDRRRITGESAAFTSGPDPRKQASIQEDRQPVAVVRVHECEEQHKVED